MTPAELVTTVPLPMWLIVDALAVHRLTRLIARDSLPPVAAARARIIARWGHSPWSELAVCSWCMSIWVAGPVIGARLLVPVPWTLLSLLLAYSTVAGTLDSRT